jgi:Mg-chelatase subunit ChlD
MDIEKTEAFSLTSSASFLEDLPSLWNTPVEYACCVELLGGSVMAKELPKDVVLVVDRSGSMREVIPIVRETCTLISRSLNAQVNKDLVPNLPFQDRLAIVVFDHESETLMDLKYLGAGEEETEEAIQKIVARGCTDISAGLVEGINALIRGKEEGRSAIGVMMLLSDGAANAGIQTPDGLVCHVQVHPPFLFN